MCCRIHMAEASCDDDCLLRRHSFFIRLLPNAALKTHVFDPEHSRVVPFMQASQ